MASEVRKLAERSATAANEIDIQSTQGVEIAQKASSQLFEIVPEIEKTSTLVQEIANASNEMSNGAQMVSSAIQQLNVVTQQNASISEEGASSAEELSAQAEELSAQAKQLFHIVSFFKLDESEDQDNSLQFRKSQIQKKEFDKSHKSIKTEGTGYKEKKAVNLDMSDNNSDLYEKF